MDDVRREALLQQLRDAQAERDQLDAATAYLSRVLGVDSVSSDGADPEWAEASYAMLKKAGRSRPLKTEELWECIHKGGVNLSGKNPAGTLYRSLF